MRDEDLRSLFKADINRPCFSAALCHVRLDARLYPQGLNLQQAQGL